MELLEEVAGEEGEECVFGCSDFVGLEGRWVRAWVGLVDVDEAGFFIGYFTLGATS